MPLWHSLLPTHLISSATIYAKWLMISTQCIHSQMVHLWIHLGPNYYKIYKPHLTNVIIAHIYHFFCALIMRIGPHLIESGILVSGTTRRPRICPLSLRKEIDGMILSLKLRIFDP